jgi:hypothetical protein
MDQSLFSRSLARAARRALVISMLGGVAGTMGACGTGEEEVELDAVDAVEGLRVGDRGEAVVRVNQELTERGYFPNEALTEKFPDWVPIVAEGPAAEDVFDERTEEAVMAFQRAHGVEASGVVDAATLEQLESAHCGNPVHEHGEASDKWHHDAQWSSPWPLGGTYTYRIVGKPSDDWTPGETNAAVDAAFNVWENVIGVDFVRQDSGSTHAVIQFKAIDGAGNTLGICYNNYWGGQRHSIEIDTAEGWAVSGSPNMSVTLVHEIGHMLGLDHSSIGAAIMFPTTNPAVTGTAVLADDDLAAITFRYRAWEPQPGVANDIGVGAAGIWAIGQLPRTGGFDIKRWTGLSWVEIGGGAVRVAVGDEPWLVNSAGRIYRRTGVTTWDRDGVAWEEPTPTMRARDIGVASGKRPWVIGTASRGSGGFAILRFNGTLWEEVGGAAVRVAVGDNGTVYVVNAQGLVYRRANITAANPLGTHWTNLGALANNIFGNETGVATDVAVSRSGIAWVVGTADGNPMAFVRQDQPAISGKAEAFSRWVPVSIPGHADNIAMWWAHDPWLTQTAGAIHRRL